MTVRTFTGTANRGLEAFIQHLATAERGLQAHLTHALDQAGKVIQDDATGRIGHYQAAVGSFPAWAQLSPTYEARKVAKGYKANAPLLASGAMLKSISRYVGLNEVVIGATDPKMVYHEFGASRMPPRPVFGPAVLATQKQVADILGHALVDGILGGHVAAGGKAYFGGDIN